MLIRALQILQKTYTDTVPRVDGLMNGHLSVYSGTIVFHCEIHSYSSLHVGNRNSHPPRHPSPRTLIPLEHSSPWNTNPPGTPIPLEHSPPPGTPIPWNTHPPKEHSSPSPII